MTASRRRQPVLRPLPGRKLPSTLKPSRVGRLAQALPGGVEDPGFESLLARIDDGLFHTGNRVEVFFLGGRTFSSMLAAVAEARSEILLESYIFKDDPTGREFQQALIQAAKRGVDVRVLADGIGSLATRGAFWAEFRRNGVEARLFHPVWALRYLKFRDHRKILVVDRRVAFTGGMNIGVEYGSSSIAGAGTGSTAWRDTHARVEGSAAWEMALVFQEGWLHAGGAPIRLQTLAAGGEAAAGARVLVLDSRPGRGAQESAAVLAAIVAAARRRLWITAAYFAPRTRALAILGGAVRRGVDVRLLLPGQSDVPIVRHAGHGFFTGLLRRGVRIFEYQPTILHAKTLVADGFVSVVGSSNLDFRSFELNAECNFVILAAAAAQTMEAQFEADLEQSAEIRPDDWQKRRRIHQLGDSAARSLAPFL